MLIHSPPVAPVIIVNLMDHASALMGNSLFEFRTLPKIAQRWKSHKLQTQQNLTPVHIVRAKFVNVNEIRTRTKSSVSAEIHWSEYRHSISDQIHMCVVKMTDVALNTTNFIVIARTMPTILTWKRFHALPLKTCRNRNLTTMPLRSFATLTVILQTFLVIHLATQQIVCLDFAIWSRLTYTTPTFTNYDEKWNIIKLYYYRPLGKSFKMEGKVNEPERGIILMM